MQKIQSTPLKIPSSVPYPSKIPSFPSFSLPKFDFSRALTGRNFLILAAVGTVLFIAYKILYKNSSKTTQDPQALSNCILLIFFNAAKEPNKGDWLTQANTFINSLKELERQGLISKSSTQDIELDRKIFKESDLCDLAIVLQYLQVAQAPEFLPDFVINIFIAQLESAFFEQLLKDKTVEEAKKSLIQSHAFLGLISSEHTMPANFLHNGTNIQFEINTLKTLFKIFEHVAQFMREVKDSASDPLDTLLKKFISPLSLENPESARLHLALILVANKITDPMKDFVAPLEKVVQGLYSSSQKNLYWNLLAGLNTVPHYIQRHWCIIAIQNLLPMKIWNGEVPELQDLDQEASSRIGSYVSQKNSIEGLLEDPNCKLTSEEQNYIGMTLAFAAGKSQDSSTRDQLRKRVKGFLIQHKLSLDEAYFVERSRQFPELTDSYHTDLRAAFGILADIAKEIDSSNQK